MRFVDSGVLMAAFGMFGLRNFEYHPIWLDCRKSVHPLRISGIEFRKNSTPQLAGAQHQRCRSELHSSARLELRSG